MGRPVTSLSWLAMQRRSAKVAAQLQVFLGTYQKPKLAKAEQAAQAKTKKLSSTGDDLERLLKAEELHRLHQPDTVRARDLRAAMTIDDLAAQQVDAERGGEQSIHLTSDLNPAFADAMVCFGMLRDVAKDKAEARKEKADRLLSQMSSQVRHGLRKRRRKPKETCVIEPEPEAPPEPPPLDLPEFKRQQREELAVPLKKFDQWMDVYLQGQGLLPKAKASEEKRKRRPRTAPR
ncbi:unnamed protein product [Effrenium voratum]|nr:unnamed protein product [Effrenium voratum]